MIKEVIVVEGRDDYTAVKRAVDAEIIITGGYALHKNAMDRIKLASQRCGVIIFTDPDYAGERIRREISKRVKGCRHAFLPVECATKDGDIGIENARSEDILEALNKARVENVQKHIEFSIDDMIRNNLLGTNEAAQKRKKLGRILGIGYANGKQFLQRLNSYNISRQEFDAAVFNINKELRE